MNYFGNSNILNIILFPAKIVYNTSKQNIANVPCEECEQCGEKYYSNEVAKQLESLVNVAKQLMQEIAIIDYSKAA
ncbi:MAG: YgiT-type zinc finger protein [Lachnospiraceae bacterium]|nr:YgiT-type zinc finger protein [Lachnospiraceae bacterium]